MLEIQEYFDEIVGFGTHLSGTIELLDNVSISLGCPYLVLYEGHPLREKWKLVDITEGKNITFIFNSVVSSSKIRLLPFEQDLPFGNTTWLPETEIVLPLNNQSNIEHINRYNLSEFLILNPRSDIKKARILDWVIEAKNFSLLISTVPTFYNLLCKGYLR
jgi:hypothetical protein